MVYRKSCSKEKRYKKGIRTSWIIYYLLSIIHSTSKLSNEFFQMTKEQTAEEYLKGNECGVVIYDGQPVKVFAEGIVNKALTLKEQETIEKYGYVNIDRVIVETTQETEARILGIIESMRQEVLSGYAHPELAEKIATNNPRLRMLNELKSQMTREKESRKDK